MIRSNCRRSKRTLDSGVGLKKNTRLELLEKLNVQNELWTAVGLMQEKHDRPDDTVCVSRFAPYLDKLTQSDALAAKCAMRGQSVSVSGCQISFALTQARLFFSSGQT